jgi:hypothetical protein
MKPIQNFFIALLCCSLLINCQSGPKDSKEKSIELVTAQTLGLAYLEEFKLEEAEKEFLKFIEMAPDQKLGYANLGLVYLRMGKYPEAENQLFEAIKIDPKDPDIRLLLATVYQMNDASDKAIATLKEALQFAPDHIKILYLINELFSSKPDADSKQQLKNYTLQLVEKAPDNLVPKLSLTEIYIQNSELDKALEQLEIINKQFPEFPKEAIEFYKKTLSLIKKKDKENAIIQFTIFHNYMKVTSIFQAGIMDLKGPGGSLIGFPLITFNQQTNAFASDNKSILEVIKFTDVTATAGLDVVSIIKETDPAEIMNSSTVAVSDYDSDGDIDLYIASYEPSSKSYKHYLLNNEMGRYSDVSEKFGLKHSGKESSAKFIDYDNDGYPDLYIVKENGDLLYLNAGKGLFKDVTTTAKIGSKTGGNKALFFDLDHDGDLDLFETGLNSNQVFRNNGDGTFLKLDEKTGLSTTTGNSTDAVFGDFDDDGDIDLVVANEKTGTILYSNQRQGIFKDLTEKSGLKNISGSRTATVGDYNNDGFLDLFITYTSDDVGVLYRNQGNGIFEPVKNSNKMFAAIQNTKVNDTKFFDFDNDGYLDMVIASEPTDKTKRGVYLYHNDGKGTFKDVSDLLGEAPNSASQIALFDYNDDGDMDLLIARSNGGVSLLRNDGGNINHYVKMKLVGLRTGSAKNNHFGIGAKVEMRSGDLYQSMVVNDPNIIFGLGGLSKADVIRITWTNGVPQNIFMPGADQALIEAQTLKGSCPFLYTWNGKEYVFAKDIIWRSALGMPMGIMGGTTQYAFADASDDYIKIPGEMLQPRDGQYSIQVTSELWETIYMDEIKLVVVDHPENIDIYVPEQFSPPPFPGEKIYKVDKKHFPVSAFDDEKNNVISQILEKDDKYVSGFKSGKYQGVTEIHDLIIDPGEAGNLENLYMIMNGWVFPTDASINMAISQSEQIKMQAPIIQVINNKGEWQTVIDFFGFPMGKDKNVVLDLSGKFLSNDRRIKIQTNMEIYWDQIFFSDCASNAPINKNVLSPVSANIHYRGFSYSFRKGGRYGPHWFDYSKVDKNKKWRDLTGNYTRYGEVMQLLSESDNQYIISNAGDETSIKFDANSLPKLKKGWKRDFLIYSVGWVKDGDINTALGSTVMPLPYHGMSSYPPSDKDIYPKNIELEKYNKQYNTRIITNKDNRDLLKGVD